MKIAVQENLIPRTSLKDKFIMAEELGFEGVEIWGRNIEERVPQLKEALSVSKIPISTICAGYRGSLLGMDYDERKLAINDIKSRLSIAAELGAIGVIVVPIFGKPKLPNLQPLYSSVEELERDLLIRELKDLGKHADDVGAYILLEPLNRYETHFIRTLRQAIEICEEVAIEHVKIMADFFHMNIEEADIPASLKEASKYLRHIHLADSNRWLPGYGHTDFKSAFETLKEVGYKYYMALECYVPEPKEESLRKSLRYLKTLIS